ncbi:protein of unknown function [Methanoculleus bourgensis]|jgi:hypothetical protein|uniref:Uncharacterized protein n=1 Tax=Methanoculleus bourgensis TaxID=83986 RepID=A0A0X3BPM3_9EURY|nr:protein of unknown function [Methanoculleus bourgensis]
MNSISRSRRSRRQQSGGKISATSVTGYEHVVATIAWAFEKLAAKRTYWEKRVKTFLSPMYAAKMVGQ